MPTASPPHLHTAGHLAPGGHQRCGCQPALSLDAPQPRRTIEGPGWLPLRGQHVAFVRAHFIYSDRMARLGA